MALRDDPSLGLEPFLSRALDHTYSASPAEAFFTGGGIHRFKNFDPRDNDRVMSVREALVSSTNLVFIRLMRDLVRFHEARLPYDSSVALERRDDSTRALLLAQIADAEAQQVLARAYHRYRNLPSQAILAKLLATNARSSRHLAMVFYAWHPSAHLLGVDRGTMTGWLQANGAQATQQDMQRLTRAYGNPRLTLTDFAYLLKRQPLELWVTGELVRDPHMSWPELLARSQPARRLASAWLFKTSNRKAQDLRLRIRIERDAFARMTLYWRELGFPLEEIVPSYATAIGSSADRPAALAELMGIVINDGGRRPVFDIRRLSFGRGTPYSTVFNRTPHQDARVMRAPIARLLREVLAEVVERGTARRVNHVFVDDQGVPISIGGKTGSGDNRIETFARGARLLSSRAVSRTACFVFYFGDRWFGVITASVSGPQAAGYSFTSSLPLATFRLLAPTLAQENGWRVSRTTQ